MPKLQNAPPPKGQAVWWLKVLGRVPPREQRHDPDRRYPHNIVALPPRVLIHGQEGVGKTTSAASFQARFLQTEDGTPPI